MRLEEIKDEYANEQGRDTWDEFFSWNELCHTGIDKMQYHHDQIAQRYAQSQTQELKEQNAELVESNELLTSKLKESKLMLSRLRRSMWVHPDCTAGSEFDDYTTDTQNLEDEIDELLTKYQMS